METWLEENMVLVFLLSHLLVTGVAVFVFFQYKYLMNDYKEIFSLVEEVEEKISYVSDHNSNIGKVKTGDIEALSGDELVDFIDSSEWTGHQHNFSTASDRELDEILDLLALIKARLKERRTYH